MGEHFGMFPGAKGFSQAVAAAQLGAEVTMIGRLGTAPFAEPFLETLASKRIESRFIVRDPDRGTGVASPLIESDGLNNIVMIPRADRRPAPSASRPRRRLCMLQTGRCCSL